MGLKLKWFNLAGGFVLTLALFQYISGRKPWEPPPASGNASPVAEEQKPQLKGTVMETMNSGGYTYVKVNTGNGEVWAAANEFNVSVGQTVYVYGANEMANFSSKTLNRTFDKIIFANSIVTEGQSEAEAAAPADPHGMNPKKEVALDFSKVKPLKGGTKVGELMAAPKKFKGKKVSIRGLIVKANYEIMGTNWYHIQDGSGTTPDNDLVVTSSSKAEVGDLVVASGAVSVDKDLGSGYFFKAILEQANLKKE